MNNSKRRDEKPEFRNWRHAKSWYLKCGYSAENAAYMADRWEAEQWRQRKGHEH